MGERSIVGALLFPPPGVVIVRVVEDEIPGRAVGIAGDACRVEERRRRVGYGGGVDARSRIGVDVGAAGPARSMYRHDRVRSVQVTQLEQSPAKSLNGVGQRGNV